MNNDDISRRGLVLGGLALTGGRMFGGQDGGAAFIRARTKARPRILPSDGRMWNTTEASRPGTIVVNYIGTVPLSRRGGRPGDALRRRRRRAGPVSQGTSNHRTQGRVAVVDANRQHDEAQTAPGAVCRRGSKADRTIRLFSTFANTVPGDVRLTFTPSGFAMRVTPRTYGAGQAPLIAAPWR